MTMKRNQSVSLTPVKKTSNTTAIASVLTGLLLAASTVNAAPEITINQSSIGSTTVVEQYSDGQVATITATPTGISMQNSMPFSVTQMTNIPRYTINQGSTTVTSLPVNTIPVTNQMTQVGVVTTPVNTIAQMLPVSTINTPAVITQTATNQAVTVTSLETLQLTPTFSTPDIVSANTKIMKNSAGRDIAVPANHIAPGDVIEYHTTYTNTTAQPVNDLNAMVSLPNGVKLVSLNSSLPTLATTGGDSYQMISQVGNAAVIQESYSGLKWNLVNLPSNAPQTVVIRAKVQ